MSVQFISNDLFFYMPTNIGLHRLSSWNVTKKPLRSKSNNNNSPAPSTGHIIHIPYDTNCLSTAQLRATTLIPILNGWNPRNSNGVMAICFKTISQFRSGSKFDLFRNVTVNEQGLLCFFLFLSSVYFPFSFCLFHSLPLSFSKKLPFYNFIVGVLYLCDKTNHSSAFCTYMCN